MLFSKFQVLAHNLGIWNIYHFLPTKKLSFYAYHETRWITSPPKSTAYSGTQMHLTLRSSPWITGLHVWGLVLEYTVSFVIQLYKCKISPSSGSLWRHANLQGGKKRFQINESLKVNTQPSNQLKKLFTIYMEETMDLTQLFLQNKSLDDILHKSSVQSKNTWASHRCGEKALQSLVNNRNENILWKK